MGAIERENSTLKGVLPRDYTRPSPDKVRLGGLVDMPGLNRNMAYMSKEVLSQAAVQEAFDNQVRSLFERVHNDNEQSRTLAALRDALLPKLLSGRLSVQTEDLNYG